MAILSNKVTERPATPDEFWIVTQEWDGGHDKRRFRLENTFTTLKAALAEKARLEKNEAEFDVVVQPYIRHFKEVYP